MNTLEELDLLLIIGGCPSCHETDWLYILSKNMDHYNSIREAQEDPGVFDINVWCYKCRLYIRKDLTTADDFREAVIEL